MSPESGRAPGGMLFEAACFGFREPECCENFGCYRLMVVNLCLLFWFAVDLSFSGYVDTWLFDPLYGYDPFYEGV